MPRRLRIEDVRFGLSALTSAAETPFATDVDVSMASSSDMGGTGISAVGVSSCEALGTLIAESIDLRFSADGVEASKGWVDDREEPLGVAEVGVDRD